MPKTTQRQRAEIRALVLRRIFIERRTIQEVADEAGVVPRTIANYVASIKAERPHPDDLCIKTEIGDMYHNLVEAEAMAFRTGAIRNALNAMAQRISLMKALGWFAPEKRIVESSFVTPAPRRVTADEMAESFQRLGYTHTDVERTE